MQHNLTKEKALIFRIVHKDNLGLVLKHGCQCRSLADDDDGYVEIGNHELIGRRRQRQVPCDPFGTLSDYVPFYFTPFTPMLYNIKTGRGVPKRPMKDILILVTSLHRISEMDLPFVFTDRHAYLRAAQFSNNLDDLEMIIWDVLRAKDFKKDDVDKFEKYQAEALVYKNVPVAALRAIICFDDAAKAFVASKVTKSGNTVKVLANHKWFL